MAFNSYNYLIFLPLTLIVYFYLNKKFNKLSPYFLIITSVFFYAVGNAAMFSKFANLALVCLFLISALFNFGISYLLLRKASLPLLVSRKMIFILGVVFNVGLLCFFKYADFFLPVINLILKTNIQNKHFPLALSFYTISQITFIVDSYERLVPGMSLWSYLRYLFFFPKLIAGPIAQFNEINPQFEADEAGRFNRINLGRGVILFSIGLIKKVLLADTLNNWSSPGFDNPLPLPFIEAWITSLTYTFQLYFDFSGYSDMAIGSALMFNVKLPVNFNSPFQSKGIIEFWSRWHISLMNFISTYIYSPMIRSFHKITFKKMMLVTFISMIISGIWHGSTWNCLFFGAIHGLALIVNNLWRKKKIKLNGFLSVLLTFNFVNFSIVFMRANTWSDAWRVVGGMVGLSGFMGQVWRENPVNLYFALVLIVFSVILTSLKNHQALKESFWPKFPSLHAVVLGLAVIFAILKLNSGTTFIYFKY